MMTNVRCATRALLEHNTGTARRSARTDSKGTVKCGCETEQTKAERTTANTV